MTLNKTYFYKRKFYFNLIFGLIYLLLPACRDSYAAYLTAAYYIPLIIVEGLVLTYIFGKRLVINDQEVANLIFWKLPLWTVVWEELEEISAMSTFNKQKSGLQGAMEPFAAFRWFASQHARGFRIKLIVTNSEAVYLNLSAIENGNEIYDILKSKARVVRG